MCRPSAAAARACPRPLELRRVAHRRRPRCLRKSLRSRPSGVESLLVTGGADDGFLIDGRAARRSGGDTSSSTSTSSLAGTSFAAASRLCCFLRHRFPLVLLPLLLQLIPLGRCRCIIRTNYWGWDTQR